jgi:gamma-D-glutamyl-L-lysine dipeptidyl-peptidase
MKHAWFFWVLALFSLQLLPLAAQSETRTTVGVTLASVYRQPSDRSEQVTQVLLGDRVQVQKIAGDWAQILVTDQYRTAQGYPGWIRVNQLTKSPSADSKESVAIAYPSVNLRLKPSLDADVAEKALLATRLLMVPESKPVQSDGEAWLPVKLKKDSRTLWVRQSQVLEERMLKRGEGDRIIERARLFKGTPYLWGGMSHHGIDCSGLIYTVYRVHGITVPRDADQQFLVGEPVAESDLEPGDMVFFGQSPDDITHVGMYAGDGNLIHASSGRGVVVNPLFQGWYLQHYQGARRILEKAPRGTKTLVPDGSEGSR